MVRSHCVRIWSQNFREVETGKVTVEIEAPSAGVLLEQKAEQDQFAKFNDVVAVIEAQD